jgi:hypothetical protein
MRGDVFVQNPVSDLDSFTENEIGTRGSMGCAKQPDESCQGHQAATGPAAHRTGMERD